MPPKLTAPGLLGTRLEHLSICADDPWVHDALAATIAALTFGLLPREILEAIRVGEVLSHRQREQRGAAFASGIHLQTTRPESADAGEAGSCC